MSPRFALIWTRDCGGSPRLVTDHPDLEVFSIDERQPGDRVYRYGNGIDRLTPAAFDQLLGTGPIHQQGDKPIQEQAARAAMASGADGRPDLRLVESDEQLFEGGKPNG